jgi:hypothetical protein
MAEVRREVSWAVFCSERTRLSASSSVVPAVHSAGNIRLFLEFVDGLPFLAIEDSSQACSASIPFTNVASVGWMVPPVAVTKVSAKAKSLESTQ